jgi:quercetin dioxygenase-like cupin family protein
MKNIVFVLVVGVGLAVASGAAAQDPITSNPKVYSLVFENAAVRVLRVSVAPGQKTTMHEHPDNAVVVFTESKMRFTGADGRSMDTAVKANEAMWSPAGKHSGENTGTSAIDGVIVELKGNNPPTATIPTSRDAATLTQAFDNPRARGYRMTTQPAFSEPAGSTHDFDQVVIALAPSDIALTVDGKTKTHWERGDAMFIGRGVKHESKNASQKPVDVFIVAIK